MLEDIWSATGGGAPQLLAELTRLRFAAENDTDCPDHHVFTAAGERAYLLALRLSQMGCDGEADGLLAALGCLFKLSPPILQPVLWNLPWSPSDGPCGAHCAPNMHSTLSENSAYIACSTHQPLRLPVIIDGLLPDAIVKNLEQGFTRHGAFFRENSYFDAASPFQSYFYSLVEKPITTIEVAAQHLAASLAGFLPSAIWEGVNSVEWWAHSRAGDDPHQLHFDMDENRLRCGETRYQRQHPVCSCVLYLSATGGPTLIIDQEPESQLGSKGWLAHPVVGRVVAFPGSLLHGVVPGSDGASGIASCHQGARTTLVMTFWAGHRTAAVGKPGTGAARHPPWRPSQPQPPLPPQQLVDAHADSAPADSAPADGIVIEDAALVSWPDDFAIVTDRDCSATDTEAPTKGASLGASTDDRLPGRRVVQCQPVIRAMLRISPVWVPVAGATDSTEVLIDARDSQKPALKRARTSNGGQGRINLAPIFPLPPLRFFITSDAEIRNAYCLTD